MNKSINDAQTELNTLQSEQVRLQAELAGLTSAEQINNYAQEHGMLPVDSNQVYYIQADGEDEVWLAERVRVGLPAHGSLYGIFCREAVYCLSDGNTL